MSCHERALLQIPGELSGMLLFFLSIYEQMSEIKLGNGGID